MRHGQGVYDGLLDLLNDVFQATDIWLRQYWSRLSLSAGSFTIESNSDIFGCNNFHRDKVLVLVELQVFYPRPFSQTTARIVVVPIFMFSCLL